MKTCSMCKVEKELNEFASKTLKSGKIIPQYHCRECQSKASRENYLKNKKIYIANAKKRKKEYKLIVYSFLVEYFQTHHCVDCGESNPIVLEFDHVKGMKFQAISNMVNGQHPIDKIRKEIEKCEVRCANCHRIQTAQRGKWKMIDICLNSSTG